MSGLFASADCAEWTAALGRYRAVLERRQSSRLPALDDWYQRELPTVLAARTPPHATLDELVRVTEWKMKRGKFRARNLVLVRNNSPVLVEEATARAFALMPDPRRPVAEIATLDGVGPATASALLAALRPDVYPFFDEEVAHAIPGLGPVKFTLPYYLKYASALRERASVLSASCPDGKWTAHRVGQALWVSETEGENRSTGNR